jgi:hypothetical protein
MFSHLTKRKKYHEKEILIEIETFAETSGILMECPVFKTLLCFQNPCRADNKPQHASEP